MHIENEAILPEQFRHTRPLSGPQKLLLGILEEAIFAFVKYNPGKVSKRNYWHWQRYQLDFDWFANEREDFGSFLFCCRHLGIDANALRTKILSGDLIPKKYKGVQSCGNGNEGRRKVASTKYKAVPKLIGGFRRSREGERDDAL